MANETNKNKPAASSEKQGFLQSLFSSLFKSSNPEAEKKRNVMDIFSNRLWAVFFFQQMALVAVKPLPSYR